MSETTLPKQAGIYLIRNKINNFFYIGSAVNLKNRWRGHLWCFRNNKHHNPRFQAAYNKYGEDAFEIRVIELAATNQCLIELEQKWLDYYNAAARRDCYNLSPKAYSMLGFKHSPESLAKMSAAQKGKVTSAEARAKQRAAKLGKKQSVEHIRKVRAALKGKKIVRRKGYSSFGHRKFTPEQIRQMRRLKAEGASFSQIETAFNISRGGLQKIINRETYREVL